MIRTEPNGTSPRSPEEARLSGDLIKRLRKQFAPGSLLHYGQGKWYPGEPLPRWALAAYWRKDGVPIWKGRFAHCRRNEELRSRSQRALGACSGALRAHSARTRNMLIPAYEDAFYYIWKERRLPSNVTPEKPNLKEKQERERLARIFQAGPGDVVGYVLPISTRDQGRLGLRRRGSCATMTRSG